MIQTDRCRFLFVKLFSINRIHVCGGVLLLGTWLLVSACVRSKPNRITSRIAAPAPRATSTADTTGLVFLRVEHPPRFQGGPEALTAYLKRTLRYPEPALRARLTGTVFVRFIVNADGSLTNIQLVKGMGFDTDAEAIRVVTAMPRWEPGQQSGKAVRVWHELPIRFELD